MFRRGKPINLRLEKVYNNEEEFQSPFNKCMYRVENRTYLKSGNKVVYKGKIGKFCSHLVKIKFLSDSEKVQMFNNSEGHNHTRMTESYKFPKELIEEFVDVKNILKPQIIQKCIYEK